MFLSLFLFLFFISVLYFGWENFQAAVKPVFSGHSKIDKTKVAKTNGSLMKVKSIAECSPLEHSAILLTCIKQ